MSTRLLDEMRDLIRRPHYPIHTGRAHRDCVRCHVRFHNMQSRHTLGHGEEKIEAFLTSPASDRQVAASIRGHAMNAFVILYEHMLKQPPRGEINAAPVAQTTPDTRRPHPRGGGSYDRTDVWSAPARLEVSVRLGFSHHGVVPAPGPRRGSENEGPHGPQRQESQESYHDVPREVRTAPEGRLFPPNAETSEKLPRFGCPQGPERAETAPPNRISGRWWDKRGTGIFAPSRRCRDTQ